MTTPVRITLRVVLVYKISPISQVRKHEPFFPFDNPVFFRQKFHETAAAARLLDQAGHAKS